MTGGRILDAGGRTRLARPTCLIAQAARQQLAQLHQHVGVFPAQVLEHDPVQPEQDAIAGGDDPRRAHAIVDQDQLAEIGRRDQTLGRTAVREQVDRTAFDDAEVIPARPGLEDRGAGQILPALEHAAHGQQRVHRQIAEQGDALEQQEPLHVELRSHDAGSGAR